jgi:basic amino acid/polyamine antiporter, APA family
MPEQRDLTTRSAEPAVPGLASKLGLFDATMIVMGGMVGGGIFINPYVVAERVHTPALIVGVWVVGGVIALLGAFVYAELGARMPQVGGEYAYLRQAFHPLLGFLYGWVALLVIGPGGAAAVAVTFARYAQHLFKIPVPETVLAAAAVAALILVNCFGVRPGSNVQSLLMVLKSVALTGLIVCGAWFLLGKHPEAQTVAWRPLIGEPVSPGLFAAIGAAMVPVMFSYGGWQTGNFVAAEIRDPRKNLSRGLLLGVAGVVVLYVGANFVYVSVLGPAGLAGSHTPGFAVMQRIAGAKGAQFIAIGITISALGFLSQTVLTYPRLLFAMAEDGLVPHGIARLHPRYRVPTIAIALLGAVTIAAILIGNYEQLLNYVEVMDCLFFGMTALCLFVFRRPAAADDVKADALGNLVLYRMPGHPLTTVIFIGVCWAVTGVTVYRYPVNSLAGFAILFAGVPFYFGWRRLTRKSNAH